MSAGLAGFAGSAGRQGERVDTLLQLLGEDPVDEALPVDAGLAIEGCGDDLDPKVGLALRPGAGVARMPIAFVDDVEPFGRESAFELAPDASLDLTHRLRPFAAFDMPVKRQSRLSLYGTPTILGRCGGLV